MLQLVKIEEDTNYIVVYGNDHFTPTDDQCEALEQKLLPLFREKNCNLKVVSGTDVKKN